MSATKIVYSKMETRRRKVESTYVKSYINYIAEGYKKNSPSVLQHKFHFRKYIFFLAPTAPSSNPEKSLPEYDVKLNHNNKGSDIF